MNHNVVYCAMFAAHTDCQNCSFFQGEKHCSLNVQDTFLIEIFSPNMWFKFLKGPPLLTFVALHDIILLFPMMIKKWFMLRSKMSRLTEMLDTAQKVSRI